MSQSYPLREPVRGSSSWAAGWHFLPSLPAMIGIWLARRQGWQDLCALDDHLLEDVGISREDALWNTRKPFWRA